MTRAIMRFHGIILHTQTLHNRLESDLVVSKMLFKNVCVTTQTILVHCRVLVHPAVSQLVLPILETLAV